MTRELSFEVWDVFTDSPFGGNQLAVIPDARGLSAEAMQAIAREFNYSESVFMLPPEAGGTIRLRIFTPGSEVPFAGHPTLGAAASLANSGYAFGQPVPLEMVIEEGAGPVACTASLSGEVWHASFNSLTPFERGAEFTPAEIAACVGLKLGDLATESHAPCLASKGLPFVIAETASREALSRAEPKRDAFSALKAANTDAPGILAIALYARGKGEAAAMRVFAPLEGIEEDPATGSAAAALSGLLCDLGGEPVSLVISQGSEMGRPSQIVAEAARAPDGTSDVTISGPAVHVMTGALFLPE
ncbi:PhzF family phenazine biosynthesis protein [Amaricoccus macauensis]|uniref:PhzF family phenazine biosynthesis protein n=1 Tax=Amaricoccus macauensis TaxID=57001 RepID=UPI003C7D1A2A